LVWFNQHYLKKTLTVGATYLISGRISLFDRKPAIFSPELEEEKEGSLNHGRFVPIYPETEGITSKWLRSRINDVLNGGKFPADIIPGEIKNKYDLKNLEWCLQKIHFPDELGQVKISRYRLGFEELFLDLLNIEARKKEWASKKNGFVINKHREKLNKLVSKLPFTLTDSQSKVLEDILHDFSQPHPMNRLLEGDVGTGKTIVALLAAYLAHLNGYKTVYLAPTEILAQQHYETFNKFLEGTGVNIGLTTSATKNGDGSSDIEIGTHALLYRPKIFEKVALLIIDEQHRFGVEQRTQLSTLAKTHKTPHVLTMTATPIPRTLALTMYGDLSLSVLKTHPHAERKITTKVVPENHREEVYNWIKKHNQPTFIVCPFVEESDIESLSNVKAAEKEY
ncbi:MAG: DNA helicase RecG, partial [Bacteroidetes bacterium CG_4_10_14_3_um_filter_42_6]